MRLNESRAIILAALIGAIAVIAAAVISLQVGEKRGEQNAAATQTAQPAISTLTPMPIVVRETDVVTVEVTRLVEVPQVVENEVTRIIEVTSAIAPVDNKTSRDTEPTETVIATPDMSNATITIVNDDIEFSVSQIEYLYGAYEGDVAMFWVTAQNRSGSPRILAISLTSSYALDEAGTKYRAGNLHIGDRAYNGTYRFDLPQDAPFRFGVVFYAPDSVKQFNLIRLAIRKYKSSSSPPDEGNLEFRYIPVPYFP